jgi:hypothetical protein
VSIVIGFALMTVLGLLLLAAGADARMLWARVIWLAEVAWRRVTGRPRISFDQSEKPWAYTSDGQLRDGWVRDDRGRAVSPPDDWSNDPVLGARPVHRHPLGYGYDHGVPGDTN